MKLPMRAVPLLAILVVASVFADDRLPVFDMHLHAMAANDQGPPPLAMCTPMQMPVWDPDIDYAEIFMGQLKDPACDDPVWSPVSDVEVFERTLAVMEKNNVVGILSGPEERVAAWKAKSPSRFYSGLEFNIARDEISPDDIKRLRAENRLDALAEVTNQYAGIEPTDPRMDPYWQVAEDLDIPVGIHIGVGPPGVIYLGSGGYRARMHSPLGLEEVLVKHPKLRVYVMHAGFPMLDDTLALLYAHPHVYVGIGVIVYTQPRPAFYRYLEAIVEAGFGKRVLFGSDQMVWPETIERGIMVIEEAPFLSEEQKRDILYNNAARFMRLSDETIAAHHGM